MYREKKKEEEENEREKERKEEKKKEFTNEYLSITKHLAYRNQIIMARLEQRERERRK
jgi:hypothetical protein